MTTRRTVMQFLGGTAIGLATAGGPPASVAFAAPADIDPLFTEPFINVDEWRDQPVRHRYVHGGFKGTDALFSMYFPPKEQYQGRFFQPLNAIPGNEKTAMSPSPISMITQENSTIGFAVDSGGYLVESNMGSKTMMWATDHTVTGYRTSAAVARYSRQLAQQMYGAHHTYGYVYGGSGGSLKTIACIENTDGVWDGAVPYVTGGPMAMPNGFTVQAHALRLLKDKMPQIIDALDPGGSGDMYAGLNAEEAAALREATRFGVPPRVWFDHERLGYGPLSTLIDQMVVWDPSYFDDFWKVPGYLGANPPDSLKRARIQHETKITRIIMSDEAARMKLLLPMAAVGSNVVPAAIEVEAMPSGELKGSTIIFTSGDAKGHVISVATNTETLISLGMGPQAYSYVKDIKVGDSIRIDNSTYLAAQTYHRHQVPDRRFYVWDQFRGSDGSPKYPQRPRLLGPLYLESGAGSFEETGRFKGKMIIVETLVDEYAYPWQADWYRSQVKKNLGDRLDENFRLYFIDNAMHTRPTKSSNYSRIISYIGALQQALRDLALWVEKGVAPPASTGYRIEDGQVAVPAAASARKGFQPLVSLKVGRKVRAELRAGTPVTLTGIIELPSGTGKIVGARWDFDGEGTYPVAGDLKLLNPEGTRASVTIQHSYERAGTHFPALRATSQRQGNATTIYGRVDNLDRVRLVVT
jgi:hypothetical protein